MKSLGLCVPVTWDHRFCSATNSRNWAIMHPKVKNQMYLSNGITMVSYVAISLGFWLPNANSNVYMGGKKSTTWNTFWNLKLVCPIPNSLCFVEIWNVTIQLFSVNYVKNVLPCGINNYVSINYGFQVWKLYLKYRVKFLPDVPCHKLFDYSEWYQYFSLGWIWE